MSDRRRSLWWRSLGFLGLLSLILGGLSLSFGLYMKRSMVRHEIAYYTEMEALERDYVRRMREQIPALQDVVHGKSTDEDLSDRVFEMLQISPAANNSREVTAWRDRPHSPERTGIALRWARLAVEEAAYLAAVHGRMKRDLERDGETRHITADEIKPPDLPRDWKWDEIAGP